MKKTSFIILVILISFLVCGCTKEKEETNVVESNGTTTIKQTIVDSDFNEKGTGTLNCTTKAVAAEGIDVAINYIINYKRGNILNLLSVQKIISSEQSNLDLYENAFADIEKNYSGLKYYDTSVVRDSNSVTYTININYEKIDVDKLLEIEGAEDNIIEKGKAKLSLWLALAEKLGTVCEEA